MMWNILKENDMNRFKDRYYETINGGTEHEKFIRTLTARQHHLYALAKKEGIKAFIYAKVPERASKFLNLETKLSFNELPKLPFLGDGAHNR